MSYNPSNYAPNGTRYNPPARKPLALRPPGEVHLSDDARKFVIFWDKNPEVWLAICEIVLELAKDGFRECSMWMVFQKLRWERYISTRGTDDDYAKLSNGLIAYYTRLFIAVFPKNRGFFTTKKMQREWWPTETMISEARELWTYRKNSRKAPRA